MSIVWIFFSASFFGISCQNHGASTNDAKPAELTGGLHCYSQVSNSHFSGNNQTSPETSRTAGAIFVAASCRLVAEWGCHQTVTNNETSCRSNSMVQWTMPRCFESIPPPLNISGPIAHLQSGRPSFASAQIWPKPEQSVANCIEIRLFPFKKQWIFLQDTAGHVWAIQKRVTSGVGIALQLHIRSVDYVRTKCPGLSGRRSVAASFPDQPLCWYIQSNNYKYMLQPSRNLCCTAIPPE